MKKTTCRQIAAGLLCTAALLTAPGCQADRTPPVMTHGQTEVTEAMYTYWMSGYKSYFLGLLGGEDTEEYLSAEITVQNDDGTDTTQTVSDYLETRISSIIDNNCISLSLFDSYELELPKMTLNSISAAVDSEIESAGGRRELNQKLSPLGLNADMLEEMYIADEKVNFLYTYLYGDPVLGTTGAEPISAEKYEKFYQDHYVFVKHIYIRTADKNVLDDAGNVQYNADGSVKTAPLTEEETKEKLALADRIAKELADGGDFDQLMQAYSEDAGRHDFPEGYIVSRSSPLPDAFITNAFDMQVGETRRVDAGYATHIMYKATLPAGAWASEKYAPMMGDFKEYVKSETYSEKIEPMLSQIVRDEELCAKHTVFNTPTTAY